MFLTIAFATLGLDIFTSLRFFDGPEGHTASANSCSKTSRLDDGAADGVVKDAHVRDVPFEPSQGGFPHFCCLHMGLGVDWVG